MNIVKQHILDSLSKEHREDSRKFDEYRKIKIEYNVIPRTAEGSARVKIGETEVIAGIKLEMGVPYPDTEDQGGIMVNIELIPLAAPEFESGPPSIDAIELSRVTDRAIRESHAIDLKKLCIKKGEEAWNVLIDIYPINNDGNLFDACALAAIAALNTAKMPSYKNKKVDYKIKKGDLPIKKLPLSCTIRKIGPHLIIDPTLNEEEAEDARITIGIMENGEVCSVQKGGDKGLTIEEIDKMVELAIKKTKELRKLLK